MENKLDYGLIGETAVSLELMKKGYDVINLNTFRHNYQNIDLLCINPLTGKTVSIQVKTGTTKNIMTGLVSEPDGTIPDLEKKIVGPWVFVRTDKELKSMTFYVLTKKEIFDLIKTSNNWYANEWNRKLTSKTLVGVFDYWLEGKGEDAKTNPKYKKQHKAYNNPLNNVTTKDKWEKITDLLQ
jgi:hypothetical protein